MLQHLFQRQPYLRLDTNPICTHNYLLFAAQRTAAIMLNRGNIYGRCCAVCQSKHVFVGKFRAHLLARYVEDAVNEPLFFSRHALRFLGGDFCSNSIASQVRLDELCFVGDRLLTDVVFGNLHGMLTVHTQPLTLTGDNRPAAVFRFLERKVRTGMPRRRSRHEGRHLVSFVNERTRGRYVGTAKPTFWP